MVEKLCWAHEVEPSHINRLCNILKLSQITYRVEPNLNLTLPTILYANVNLGICNEIPIQYLRYISRIFYVPYTCRDMSWIYYSNSESKSFFNNIYKVQCYPKSLELNLIEMLLNDQIDDSKLIPQIRVHPTKYSHTLFCVYSHHESLFYWGILSLDEIILNQMTSELIYRHLNLINSNIQPICRAYYKMKEIIEGYLTNLNWKLPNNQQTIAIDIGASPGGWSQYLSPICNIIFSIDPGLISIDVLNTCNNIIHIKSLAESDDTKNILLTNLTKNEKIINIKIDKNYLKYLYVCDINTSAISASKILTNSIFPIIKSLSNTSLTNLNDENNDYDSLLILTLKLVKKPNDNNIERITTKVCELLKLNGNCYDFQIVHLHANTRSERTIICKLLSINNI